MVEVLSLYTYRKSWKVMVVCPAKRWQFQSFNGVSLERSGFIWSINTISCFEILYLWSDYESESCYKFDANLLSHICNFIAHVRWRTKLGTIIELCSIQFSFAPLETDGANLESRVTIATILSNIFSIETRNLNAKWQEFIILHNLLWPLVDTTTLSDLNGRVTYFKSLSQTS